MLETIALDFQTNHGGFPHLLLGTVYITMENKHVQWINPLFPWPFFPELHWPKKTGSQAPYTFSNIGLTMAVLVPPFTVALITTNVQAVIQWLVLSILSELLFLPSFERFWMDDP